MENKLLAGISILTVILLLGVAGLLTGMTNQSALQATRGDSGDLAENSIMPAPDNTGSYVEVQQADVEVKSDDIEADISAIRNLSESYGGWVESSSRRDNDIYTTADLQVKVESENFGEFMDELRERQDVESYDVRNYRLYTQDELDELDILNKTMKDYEAIRDEIKAMENDGEKLELLMSVTEKQLELKEKKRRYQDSLDSKRQRGDYATVNIQLRERREIDLTPDDLGARFRNEVNEMVGNVADTLITTLTGGVEIFFSAIKYLIFLAIVALPAIMAYRIGKKVYRRF